MQPQASVMSAAAELGDATRQPDGPHRRTRLGVIAAQLQLLWDPLGTVTKRFARYGDVYRVQQGGDALYVFRHPDHIKDIMLTNAAAFDKGHSAFQRLSLVLGDALLTSDGERWRRQRRLVQPAFARPRLAEYSSAMVEESTRAAERLARGGTFDITREMNTLTLSIVTRTLFGQAAEEGGRTAQAMVDLNRWFGSPPQLERFVPGNAARFKRAVTTLDDVIGQLIEAKRNAASPGRDLLTALMAARDETGEALSPSELRDQLLTLYLAGHETTSHALSWTLYLLSQHPQAREALDAEHARVLAGRVPTFEDVANLTYTEQVLKEALRLYPPAFLLPRRAAQDVNVGPYHLPKGSELIIWTLLTQRDARWYPEPEAFRPERWQPEAEAARPKYAYLPFGAGQRACIGQMFAMIEAQLVLATLLPRLRFAYAGKKPPRMSLGITLSARGGMPMRVSARG